MQKCLVIWKLQYLQRPVCIYTLLLSLYLQPNYRCICEDGWTHGNSSDPACNTDVNECHAARSPCSINPPVPCINVPGTFYCGSCPAGNCPAPWFWPHPWYWPHPGIGYTLVLATSWFWPHLVLATPWYWPNPGIGHTPGISQTLALAILPYTDPLPSVNLQISFANQHPIQTHLCRQ